MANELLTHVFSSLSALEKCFEDVRSMIGVNRKAERRHSGDLRQQERVLQHMRRVANKLQLQLAKEDMREAIRSLQIYYGLNSMVRPAVMSIYAELANTRNPFEAVEAQLTVH